MSTLYSKEDQELARQAKALAAPLRINLLKILVTNGGWISDKAFSALQLSPELLHRHLGALNKIGLVQIKTEPGTTLYAIDPTAFEHMSTQFVHLLPKQPHV